MFGWASKDYRIMYVEQSDCCVLYFKEYYVVLKIEQLFNTNPNIVMDYISGLYPSIAQEELLDIVVLLYAQASAMRTLWENL